MGANEARAAYEALSQYFGLRASDTYLNSIVGNSPATSPTESSNSLISKFLKEIFGDGNSFQTSSQIKNNFGSITNGDNPDPVGNLVCITAMNSDEHSSIVPTALQNETSAQGWGIGSNDVVYFLNDFLYGDDSKKKAVVYQIFPAEYGLDVADTDIVSLYMNSLTTLEISRAVPYLEVKVIGFADFDAGGNFKRAPAFSLGKFLGANPDSADAMLAKFTGGISSKRASQENLAVVAGMEIFTSPQTMVNAENVVYDRRVGGPIDAFRPFMSLLSFKVSDTPSGAGTITYKSADLALKLWDKGRLPDVAPFVTPRRDGNVRFEITYGWSHPDGSNFARNSDASDQKRIGSLIDAMRVTESYVLINSSYSFEADGSVSINLKLTMDSTSEIFNTDITSFSSAGLLSGSNVGSINLTDVANKLQSIGSAFRDAAGTAGSNMKLPQFLTSPTLENMLTLDKESLEKLRKSAAEISKKKGKLADAAKDLLTLIGKTNTKGSKAGGAASAILASRKSQATSFVEHLRTTPDPFLRPATNTVNETDLSRGTGSLKKGEKPSDKKKQSYVSYGKLITQVILGALNYDDVEVQFIFSAFNHNAGGVFDHNISQFPISLDLLQKDLEEEFERRFAFTVDQVIKFVNEKYIQFSGSGAYGLSDIFEKDQRDKDGKDPQGKFKDSIKKKSEDGDTVSIGDAQRENLERIYGKGKRSSPTFTIPRVSARIVKKKANTPSGPIKEVVRIYFADEACGRVMSTAETVSNLMQKGFFYEDDLTNDLNKKRFNFSAQHGKSYKKMVQNLIDKKITDKLENVLKENPIKFGANENTVNSIQGLIDKAGTDLSDGDKAKLKQKLESAYIVKTGAALQPKSDIRIKELISENAPYLSYGTGASGVVEASVQTEQDSNLTSMYLAQRFSGRGTSPTANRTDALPFETHPARLSLRLIGCPLVRLTQKYFVDLGTNSTLDNFYVVSKAEHDIGTEKFETSIDLIPYDVYGKFLISFDKIIETFTQGIVSELHLGQKSKPAKGK